MKPYRLLVVDDQGERESGYETILGGPSGFSLQFCFSPDEVFHTIARTQMHGYVVDVRLWEGDDSHTDYFREVMKAIAEKDSPIVLLSSKWTEEGTFDLLSRLSPEERKNIRHFAAWDEHWTPESGEEIKPMASSTRGNIRTALDQHYSRSGMIVDDDRKLSILHLSDLQFGDANTSADSFLDEKEVADKARKHEIAFMVITGDVSYSGRPEEFAQAKEWLTRVAKRLWPREDLSGRVIVVPGNHDIDLRVCAAARHDYKFAPPGAASSEWKLVPQKRCLGPYSGLGHYKDFLFEMTREDRWLLPQTDAWQCVDRFLGCGLRFVCLNSAAEVDVDAPSRCSMNKIAMERLSDQIETRNALEDADQLFTIALSHHGFTDAKTEGIENAEELKRFLDLTKVDMLLCGHGHGGFVRQEPDGNLYGMVTGMAPTLRLKQSDRQEDALRGFHVYELMRKGGVVTKVRWVPYEIREGRARIKSVDGPTEWEPRAKLQGELKF